MMRLTVWLLLAKASLVHAADPWPGLEDQVQAALKKHGVPGLAVAVVKDGTPILSRGFGVKEVGQSEAVDDNTLFAIGSVTKSFTAAMVAMLVHEKKMRWDDSIRRHYPDFRLQDRYLSDEVTIRDCLSHRVGLPRYDLVWYGATLNRGQLLDRLPKMKSASSIRTRFIYNNILYLAVGEAAAKAAGQEWDVFIQERMFKPLGMEHANTSVRQIQPTSNAAKPHKKLKGQPQPIPWRNLDNIGPAGSINASASDMAKYIHFQLTRGKAGTERLIDAEIFRAMHEPVITLPKPTFSMNPDARLRAYGMGWFVSEYRNCLLVNHGGNIDGMSACVLLLPEKKIGVCVLANLDASLLPEALGFDLLDRLLGAEPRNLAESSSVLAHISEVGVQAAAEPNPKLQIKETKPSFELRKYTGTYEDDLHSAITVVLEEEKLVLKMGELVFDLEHWHYDTFVGTDRGKIWPKLLFTFDQTSEGGVAALRAWPQGEELRFKRTGGVPAP